jgi:hypothetical protein
VGVASRGHCVNQHPGSEVKKPKDGSHRLVKL